MAEETTIQATDLTDAVMKIRQGISKEEARRIIEYGGVRVNNVRIHQGMDIELTPGMVVSVGQKDSGRIK
jgi:ribosomal protein S4